MKLNENYLNIQLLQTRTISLADVASAMVCLREIDEIDAESIANELKHEIFGPMTKGSGDGLGFSFRYVEYRNRVDESRVTIGEIEIDNNVRPFSCYVTVAIYSNDVLALSISPDQPCSSFDYNISIKEHNAGCQ